MDEQDQFIEDFATIAYFLLWQQHANPNAMWGGRTITEVVEAFKRITELGPQVEFIQQFVISSIDNS